MRRAAKREAGSLCLLMRTAAEAPRSRLTIKSAWSERSAHSKAHIHNHYLMHFTDHPVHGLPCTASPLCIHTHVTPYLPFYHLYPIPMPHQSLHKHQDTQRMQLIQVQQTTGSLISSLDLFPRPNLSSAPSPPLLRPRLRGSYLLLLLRGYTETLRLVGCHA